MRRFWQFRNAAQPGTGELFIYGTIGADSPLAWLFEDGATPKAFKADLDALGDISELQVFINSDGGDVFAGQAIHSMLKRHPANVTVFVDGIAASIASVIAMAGDKVIMPRNAMMMVHNPAGLTFGDAEEHRKMAETLDQVRESIVAAYEGKTGMEHDELVAMLEAETWMTAQEAVDNGFADEIEEAKQVAASLVAPKILLVNGQAVHLDRFDNPPDVLIQSRSETEREPNKRDTEKALRDAGFSVRDARKFVAAGWKALDGVRDEPPEEPTPEPVNTDVDRLRDYEYLRLKALAMGVTQ